MLRGLMHASNLCSDERAIDIPYHVEWLSPSNTRNNSQVSRNGEKELQQAGTSDMAALPLMLNPTSPTPPCAICDATTTPDNE